MRILASDFNLGSDPELRYSGDGQWAIAKVSLAENKRYTDKDGVTQTKTSWFRLVCFSPVIGGKTGRAEWFARTCGKGDKVEIIGDFESQTFEDKDGNQRTGYQLVVRGGQNSIRMVHKAQPKSDTVDAPPVDDYDETTDSTF
jgi:single stranded DNA-binding protein